MCIRDRVWANNLEDEIKKISKLIEKFPYVSMDTEFPGIVHNISLKHNESKYKSIKANVLLLYTSHTVVDITRGVLSCRRTI